MTNLTVREAPRKPPGQRERSRSRFIEWAVPMLMIDGFPLQKATQEALRLWALGLEE